MHNNYAFVSFYAFLVAYFSDLNNQVKYSIKNCFHELIEGINEERDLLLIQ